MRQITENSFVSSEESRTLVDKRGLSIKQSNVFIAGNRVQTQLLCYVFLCVYLSGEQYAALNVHPFACKCNETPKWEGKKREMKEEAGREKVFDFFYEPSYDLVLWLDEGTAQKKRFPKVNLELCHFGL